MAMIHAWWARLLTFLAGPSCLRGLRLDNPECCADLDAARWQRRQMQWERERCGL